MTIYRAVHVIALLFLVGGAASAQTMWRRVSSFQFDWDGHKSVQIVLELPVSWSDPGDFTRIRIRVPGRQEFTLSNEDGWVKYAASDFAGSAGNLLPSQHIPGVKAATNRTLLFLLGFPYASSPGSLDVLEISDEGDVRRVFHRDEFGLKEVRDLDGDGISEVIGYPCLSEAWGDGLLTYDPYNVYKLGETRGQEATLSLPLSREYNLNYYYGWAGPECSQDLAVVLHPPKGGKPIVVSAKEAQRLTDKKP